MDPNVSHKPNKDGAEVSKIPSGQVRPIWRSMSGLGESSRLPMVMVASMVFEAPMGAESPILCNNSLPGQATEHLTSISVVSHPDREVDRYFGDDPRIKVEP